MTDYKKEIEEILKKYSKSDCTKGVSMERCFETQTFFEEAILSLISQSNHQLIRDLKEWVEENEFRGVVGTDQLDDYLTSKEEK